MTVSLEGVRITGEWESHRSKAQAKDFPVGNDVQAAMRLNLLLLEHPDGSVVTARIVHRVKPDDNEKDEDERD